MSQTSIVFFARDPGPANQVLAALELRRAGSEMKSAEGMQRFLKDCGDIDREILLARGAAIEVFRRGGLNPLVWDDEIPNTNPESVVRKLSGWQAKAVVTGTSDVDDECDRLLWRCASKLGIDSHVFLDFPSALRERFRDSDGRAVVPTCIYAPDESYLALLEAAGVNLRQVRICGSIHTQRLQSRSRSAASRWLRTTWGAAEQDVVVLFASQCLREMAAAGRPSPHDEIRVLEDLTGRLQRGAPVGDMDLRPADAMLVVRPHPRDTLGKYDSWRAAETAPLRRIVSADGSPEEAIVAADWVVGIDSSLLRDARALGRPAFSLVDARIDYVA